MTNAFCTLLFVLRYNLVLGIPDFAWAFLTELTLGSLILGFTYLPLSILMAKITPPHIEGTMFAFLASLRNINNSAGGF